MVVCNELGQSCDLMSENNLCNDGDFCKRWRCVIYMWHALLYCRKIVHVGVMSKQRVATQILLYNETNSIKFMIAAARLDVNVFSARRSVPWTNS